MSFHPLLYMYQKRIQLLNCQTVQYQTNEFQQFSAHLLLLQACWSLVSIGQADYYHIHSASLVTAIDRQFQQTAEKMKNNTTITCTFNIRMCQLSDGLFTATAYYLSQCIIHILLKCQNTCQTSETLLHQ